MLFQPNVKFSHYTFVIGRVIISPKGLVVCQTYCILSVPCFFFFYQGFYRALGDLISSLNSHLGYKDLKPDIPPSTPETAFNRKEGFLLSAVM